MFEWFTRIFKNDDSHLSDLVTQMLTNNSENQAISLKAVVAYFSHSDPNMVKIAATGLCDSGTIGYRMCERGVRDMSLSEVNRTIIHTAMKNTPSFQKVSLSWDNLEQEIFVLVKQVSDEVRIYGISSQFMATFPERSDHVLRMGFSIDLEDQELYQAMLTLQFVDSEEKPSDEFSIPVMRAFKQFIALNENHELTAMGVSRYFTGCPTDAFLEPKNRT